MHIGSRKEPQIDRDALGQPRVRKPSSLVSVSHGGIRIGVLWRAKSKSKVPSTLQDLPDLH